jgi:hypothetical protein
MGRFVQIKKGKKSDGEGCVEKRKEMQMGRFVQRKKERN